MSVNILVACEESQAVTKEFRELGYNCFSCDLLPTSGDHPEWHIQGDVMGVIHPRPTGNGYGYRPLINFITTDGTYHVLDSKWDVIIAFPPCTYLTVTGNRWFNIERYGEKAIKRHEDRKKAIEFFMAIANADCHRILIENPVGVMSKEFRKPDQIINPYQFGDPFEKRTCLWLKNLPKLKPTNMVKPPERSRFRSGKTMPTWYSDAWHLSSEERQRVRGKTFPGIAKAIAEQIDKFLFPF